MLILVWLYYCRSQRHGGCFFVNLTIHIMVKRFFRLLTNTFRCNNTSILAIKPLHLTLTSHWAKKLNSKYVKTLIVERLVPPTLLFYNVTTHKLITQFIVSSQLAHQPL